MNAQLFFGTGHGVQTTDGCSVEVYRRMPYRGELDPVRSEFGAGTSVLELGCGTGRLTRALLSYGCMVTAVDSSSEMLASVPAAAHAIESSIEELNLARKFDIVLLAAGLINHCDASVRSAFIRVAAAHSEPHGRLIFERQDPTWLASAKEGPTRNGPGMCVNVEAVHRVGAVIQMRVRYTEADESWTHSFVLEALDETTLQKEVSAGGFDRVEWLDVKRCWARAVLQTVA